MALESVVVSGSRIKRDTFSSPAPITVIRSEDAALSSPGSTAEMLLSVGVTGGPGQINSVRAFIGAGNSYSSQGVAPRSLGTSRAGAFFVRRNRALAL